MLVQARQQFGHQTGEEEAYRRRYQETGFIAHAWRCSICGAVSVRRFLPQSWNPISQTRVHF